MAQHPGGEGDARTVRQRERRPARGGPHVRVVLCQHHAVRVRQHHVPPLTGPVPGADGVDDTIAVDEVEADVEDVEGGGGGHVWWGPAEKGGRRGLSADYADFADSQISRMGGGECSRGDAATQRRGAELDRLKGTVA